MPNAAARPEREQRWRDAGWTSGRSGGSTAPETFGVCCTLRTRVRISFPLPETLMDNDYAELSIHERLSVQHFYLCLRS